VRSASGDDGRKLFQCGAQSARKQGPRCNEPVRQSTSTSCTFTDILFCSEPINEKRIFTEYNSNMHNNMLSFRVRVFSDRERENSQKFSGQGIFLRMFSPKIIHADIT
jgi:hypothetical protein